MNIQSILLVFIALALSISVAQSNPVLDIHKKLSGTQWTGKAGIPNKEGGLSWAKINAHMSFEVKDGRLFYLSKILGILDSGIEKKAQGLCKKSPPREAVLFPSDDGNRINGRVVLADVVSEPGKMKFYSIPLENLRIADGKLKFHSILREMEAGGKIRQLRVSYELSEIASVETADLAGRLTKCLDDKPWESK